MLKYQKGTFVVVPNIERLDVLPALAQALFLWLCKFADDDGICFPSRKKLAGLLHCDMRTVDKNIGFLIELGFITKTNRKKNSSKEFMSNLYQILLVEVVHTMSYPSTSDATTPSSQDVPITKPILNSIQLTKIDEPKVREDKPFIFKEEMDRLRESTWIPDRILYLYWIKKGFTFENRRQMNTARGRSLKSAVALQGYDSEQVESTMDYCEENFNKFSWSLETVIKRIDQFIKDNE